MSITATSVRDAKTASFYGLGPARVLGLAVPGRQIRRAFLRVDLVPQGLNNLHGCFYCARPPFIINSLLEGPETRLFSFRQCFCRVMFGALAPSRLLSRNPNRTRQIIGP